ncbi:MAG: restriction endonuclease subunit S [Bacteroidota bacterium]
MTQIKNNPTPPPGYKQTKIGLLPEEWEINTVGKSLDIVNGPRKPISATIRYQMKGKYPYYGPTKIQDYINEFQYEGRFALIAEDGDHFLKYSDRPMTQIAQGKFNVNNHAHVIKGNSNCTTDWFYYFFQHRSIFAYLTRQGAGRYKLNKSALKQLPIPLPPLPEQRAIAAILTTWDRAIQTQQKLIAAKQEQKRGLMQRLLTGEVRLEGFDGEWEKNRLGDLVKKAKGKIVPTHHDEDGLPYVGASNFSGKYSQYSKELDKGVICEDQDILMLWDGENAGAVSIGHHGIISSTVAKLTPKKSTNSNFLFQKLDLLNNRIRSTRTGSGIPHVAKDLLHFFKLSIPPLSEQRAIATILTAADREITLLEQELEALQAQKKGLMQRLLTGQVRVPAHLIEKHRHEPAEL